MEVKTYQFFNYHRYIRDLSYIRQSAADLLDLVFNTILFCLGIYFFSDNQTFFLNSDHYSLFINHKLSEIQLSICFLFVSISNFVRLFYPFRLKLCLVTLLKSLTLFCMLILFFNEVYKPPLLSSAVTYFILVFFTFRSVMQVK